MLLAHVVFGLVEVVGVTPRKVRLGWQYDAVGNVFPFSVTWMSKIDF